jgi:hypothetical protein
MKRLFFWQKIGLVSLMAMPMLDVFTQTVNVQIDPSTLKLVADSIADAGGIFVSLWFMASLVKKDLLKRRTDMVGASGAVLALASVPQAVALTDVAHTMPTGRIIVMVVCAGYAIASLFAAEGLRIYPWLLMGLAVQITACHFAKQDWPLYMPVLGLLGIALTQTLNERFGIRPLGNDIQSVERRHWRPSRRRHWYRRSCRPRPRRIIRTG